MKNILNKPLLIEIQNKEKLFYIDRFIVNRPYNIAYCCNTCDKRETRIFRFHVSHVTFRSSEANDSTWGLIHRVSYVNVRLAIPLHESSSLRKSVCAISFLRLDR